METLRRGYQYPAENVYSCALTVTTIHISTNMHTARTNAPIVFRYNLAYVDTTYWKNNHARLIYIK